MKLYDALIWATQGIAESNSDSAKWDAKALLKFVMNYSDTELIIHDQQEMTQAQYNQYANLIEKRLSGEPVAYLCGTREFWSREFFVNEHTLIPRPETELLIEKAMSEIESKPVSRILDLGTGSGIIAITLAKAYPNIHVVAVDKSEGAIDMAKQNAIYHDSKNIEFIVSDWFDRLDSHEKFDMIVSNPPYIRNDDIHLTQGDVRFEPLSALASGDSGLADIEKIITMSKRYLSPNSILLLEHGYDQAKDINSLFQRYLYSDICLYTDINGNDRATQARSV